MSDIPMISTAIAEVRALVAALRTKADSITERCMQGDLAKPEHMATAGTWAVIVGLQMASNMADERLRELLEAQDAELRKEPTP